MNLEYPKNISFECSKCGLCCGDTNRKSRRILLLNSDVQRISDRTNLKVEEYADKIENVEPYTHRIKKNLQGKCVFLKENLCSIYGNRPLICRFYPFNLKNLGNNKYKFSYTKECPGIGKGSLIHKEFYEKLVKIRLRAD